MKGNLIIRFNNLRDNVETTLTINKKELDSNVLYRLLKEKLIVYDEKFHIHIIRNFFSNTQRVWLGKSFTDYIDIYSHTIEDWDVPISYLSECQIKYKWE